MRKNKGVLSDQIQTLKMKKEVSLWGKMVKLSRLLRFLEREPADRRRETLLFILRLQKKKLILVTLDFLSLN